MNRKGQVLSSSLTLGWKLFRLAAIALFIVWVVGGLFSSNQDVRPAEATILEERIINCLVNEGIVQSNFNLNECFAEDQEIYVNANLSSMDSNFSRSVVSGNRAFGVPCNVGDEKLYCDSQRYYVLINNQKIERGVLELTVGIDKYDKN